MTRPVVGIDLYRKSKKTPLQELAERVWAKSDPTDEDTLEEKSQEATDNQEDQEDSFTGAS